MTKKTIGSLLKNHNDELAKLLGDFTDISGDEELVKLGYVASDGGTYAKENEVNQLRRFVILESVLNDAIRCSLLGDHTNVETKPASVETQKIKIIAFREQNSRGWRSWLRKLSWRKLGLQLSGKVNKMIGNLIFGGGDQGSGTNGVSTEPGAG